jgi:pimeloyl-ACP methyl ester carboxylesterase
LNKLFRQRELLFDLGGEFVSEVSQEKLTSWMASGPTEYQSSWEKMYQTCTFSMEHLWKEVVSKDLMTECQSLKIPVTILQGRNDFCTASSIAFQWFQRLQSKRKQFIWFENSAHWPQFEENEKWSKFFLEYPILSYR